MDSSEQTEEEKIILAYLIGQLKNMFLTTEFFEKFYNSEDIFDKFGNIKIEEEDIYEKCKKKYPEISAGVDTCHIIDSLDTVEEVKNFLRSEHISRSEIEQIIERAREFAKTFLEQKKGKRYGGIEGKKRTRTTHKTIRKNG